MRIGLNLLYLIPGVVGGTETYARGLIEGLRRINADYEFVLFLNRENSGLTIDDRTHFSTVVCPVNATRRGRRYFFEQVQFNRYLKEQRIDLLHSLGYISPLFASCPLVVTVPDLNFRAFGHMMPALRREVLKFFVGRSVKRADKVAVISEFSRREVLEAYGLSPQKVTVTPLATTTLLAQEPDEESKRKARERFGLKLPYALAFSSTTPNKNIGRLLDAFRSARKSPNFDHRLVLIGHKPEGMDDGREFDSDIFWVGYVEREEVHTLLRSADFLIFPSFYEGFGLPILEAMAAGIPVTCSYAASLPEVAGNAALFFDPYSIDDISDKISQMATNPQLKEDLRQKGNQNLKRFSWAATAAKTVAVYDEVLKGR